MAADVKILLLGASGQVGQALTARRPAGFGLVAPGRSQADFLVAGALARAVDQFRPALVINCAAYNQVDRAETEPALASRINGAAVEELAQACDPLAIPLIHFSTDYVFPDLPRGLYTEAHRPAPLNHYGHSKLQGERAAHAVAHNLVLRVSWVFSEYGQNMGARILAQAMQGVPLQAATDQYSSPTYAGHIADAVWALVPDLLAGQAGGLYHLSGLAGGEPAASRYELASALVDEARRLGLVADDFRVQPVLQSHWQTTALRPACSALCNDALAQRLGRPLPDWRAGVVQAVAGIRAKMPPFN